MKMISWNVNGLRACVTKGFLDVFQSLDADIFALQETKLQPHQIDLELPGYQQFFNSAEKKGYSGTARAGSLWMCATALVFRRWTRRAV